MNPKEQGSGNRGEGPAPASARAILLDRGAAVVLAATLVVFAPIARAQTVKLDANAAAARIVEVSFAAQAASARNEASQHTVESADAVLLPILTANAAVAQRSSVPEFRLPLSLPGVEIPVLAPNITTTYGTTLKAQETLYAGGAIEGQRQATRHDAAASSAVRLGTLADLRLAAQTAYWEAVRTAASVEAVNAQEERAQRLVGDTQAMFEAGMAVRADVLAARERAALAHVQVINAQAAAANALDQLRSLLHYERDTKLELVDSLSAPLPPSPAPLMELRRQALAGRPELAATAAQLAALREREILAGAPVRPALAAIAQWDYNRPNQRYFPQTDEWKKSWSVGLVASWTLFDGGKAGADTATSRANQRAAERDRDELQRRILLEVDTSLRQLTSALATVEAADAARDAGDEREKAARERLQAGLAQMAEVLDAQADLAAAEQQQINSRASSWLAAAVLARVTGQ